MELFGIDEKYLEDETREKMLMQARASKSCGCCRLPSTMSKK